jgi:sterol desaturase/sphingolipid hydroxylase (fatty acid hydroxylase superfamily)
VGSEGPTPLYAFFNDYSVAIAGGLIGLAFVESLIRALRGRPVPNRTVALNLGMWLFELVLRTSTGGLRWLAFVTLARFAPITWAMHAWQWVVLYLLVDFFYYSRHRLLHETRWGWTLHAPHHASVDLSITSSLRLGWIQRTIDDFFYLPLVLLGAPPLALFIVIELDHASQFWCHTELIDRLPWLDRVFNTPSNHRVHHAQDRKFADSNYGATFMLWDRLLGTYQPEPAERLPMGWEEPYAGHNPFIIQFRTLLLSLSPKTHNQLHGPATSAVIATVTQALGTAPTTSTDEPKPAKKNIPIELPVTENTPR